jgi:hypothetical protein
MSEIHGTYYGFLKLFGINKNMIDDLNIYEFFKRKDILEDAKNLIKLYDTVKEIVTKINMANNMSAAMGDRLVDIAFELKKYLINIKTLARLER